MKNKLTILFSILFILPFSSFAKKSNNDMIITSNIEKTCMVKTNDINFGEWNINIGETIKTFNIDVLCNKDTFYTLSGEDKAGPYPHQNGTTSWQRVIKMHGTKPDNKDWLAYRIHINIPTLPLFSIGDKYSINAQGTGDYVSHSFKAYLFGNTVDFPGRFISVTPDVYVDIFSVYLTY